MKKLVVITTVLLTGLAVNAQNVGSEVNKEEVAIEKNQPPKHKPPGVHRGSMRMEEMENVVDLTEDQKAKIADINSSQDAKMKVIRDKYRDSKDVSAMREEIRIVQQERRQKVRNLLTEEQQKKWKAHQVKKRQGSGPEGKPRPNQPVRK